MPGLSQSIACDSTLFLDVILSLSHPKEELAKFWFMPFVLSFTSRFCLIHLHENRSCIRWKFLHGKQKLEGAWLLNFMENEKLKACCCTCASALVVLYRVTHLDVCNSYHLHLYFRLLLNFDIKYF